MSGRASNSAFHCARSRSITACERMRSVSVAIRRWMSGSWSRPDARAEFGTNIDRVNTLLRIVLVDKTLAKQARASGLDHDPDIQRRIATETDRILSQAVIERDLAQWNAEFDARPDMATAARERWLAQPAKYSAPEDVQLTQILYAMPKNSRADARAKALDARGRILAGADMGGIAKSESDDAATAPTGGKIDWLPVDHLDPSVSRAISRSLHKPGDLSQPIVAEAGVYLVRLDAQRPGVQTPFDEVKASIMKDLRKEYVDTMRAKKMAAIRDDPSIVVNQPAVDALVVRIDPDFARKAVQGAGAKAGRGESKEPSPVK